jgi:PPM family protein phosphatase
VKIRTAFATDPGLQRSENEDSVAVARNRAGVDALLVVCDGMGGHAAGHLASSIAVETFVDAFETDGSEKAGADPDRLKKASAKTNTAVHEASLQNAAWAGMGSTLVVAAIDGNELAIANVGDSPAYLVRDGKLRLISQDHSWPAEQVRLGLISPAEARDHPMKHRLTRAVGVWEHIPAFVDRVRLQAGDTIVLCTDGVETAGVSVDEMWELLKGRDLEDGIRRVIARCRELGAPDNVTMAVARVEGAAEPAAKTQVLPVLKKRG